MVFIAHRNIFDVMISLSSQHMLTHWGRVTHICVSKLTIIGSDNGLSPERHEAIIWINVGILLIGPLGTNFSEILIEIYTFSFKTTHLKMPSGKWRPFCLGLIVLTLYMLNSTLLKEYENTQLHLQAFLLNDTDSWNIPGRKTETCLPCIVSAVCADN